MPSSSYTTAVETYAQLGVDVEAALTKLATIPISLQCWQGDDVGGFEKPSAKLEGGGIQVTGSYPGKARSIDELRQDLDQALALIPGKHRVNLHASYADLQGKLVERNQLTPDHFKSWIAWAKERGLGLDFNPTYYSHPLSDDGFTLSHSKASTRKYWIEHGIACREIAAEMGKQLGNTVITNFWIPDGHKDLPVDRKGPRERLEASLNEVFAKEINPKFNRDAVESKLFGIGSEAYVVGSHEFYYGYALKHKKILCLDAGHFHPTEQLADKISSTLQFIPEILLHVSRGVRWDSDHVVILDDATQALMTELVRGEFLSSTHVGMDFFDASINRIACWVIGARTVLKALLIALLEPRKLLFDAEAEADYTSRLALLEEAKMLPHGIVWAEYCQRNNVPVGHNWLPTVKQYEAKVLSRRA
jgi:L-rhamnose isomerase